MIGHLRLLKRICNLSHLSWTSVILGLNHVNVTRRHPLTDLAKFDKTAAPHVLLLFFFRTKLHLSAHIPPFIGDIVFCLCSYIPLVFFPPLNPITVAAAAI